MAATYNKFNSFTEAVAEKLHNLGSDQLRIALSAVAPVATDAILTDITEIAYTNITEDRNVTTSTSAQTSGVYKLVLADLTLNATGTVADWRYITLYNDTATNNELIAWFDYGSTVTLLTGESFLVDFDGAGGALTIT